MRQSWYRFFKTARYHVFRTAVHPYQFLFFEIFDLPGYNFCDERFDFHANAVIPADVEDLPTEAIQQTKSLIGAYLTCPRDIDRSESVRPFPSVVRGICVPKLPEDNLLGCASENLGLSSKHVRELAECSCQSTSRSGELSGALTLSITSLRVNVRQ